MAALRYRREGTDKGDRPFAIRSFESDDRPELERMYEEFIPKRIAQGLPPEDERQRQRWLDSVLRQGQHLVVVVDGVVEGHGMILPFGDGRAELANFLHHTTRNRGIGTELNRALMEVAAQLGIHSIWLSVEPSNRPAIRSYEKVGFRRRPVTAWAPEIEMEVSI